MIFRVTNPAAFRLLAFRTLMEKAAVRHQKSDIPQLIEELADLVEKPHCGLFVGEENGELKGVYIIFLPNGYLYTVPQVFTIYNEGSENLLNGLLDAGIEFIKAAGYNKLWAITREPKQGLVYGRKFKKVGPIKAIGDVIEFQVR